MPNIYKSPNFAFNSVHKFHKIIGSAKKWKLFFIINELIIFQNLPFSVERFIPQSDLVKLLERYDKSYYTFERIRNLIYQMKNPTADSFNFEEQLKIAKIIQNSPNVVPSMYDHSIVEFQTERIEKIINDLIIYKNLRDHCIGGIFYAFRKATIIQKGEKNLCFIIEQHKLLLQKELFGLKSKTISQMVSSQVLVIDDYASLIISRGNNYIFNDEETTIDIVYDNDKFSLLNFRSI